MRPLIGALTGLALLAGAPAFAQQTQTSPRWHGSESTPGVRGGLVIDVNSMAASKSFHATIGTSRLLARGFAVEATGLWRGAFARLAATSMSHDGSRVFVNNGTAFDLHIPFHVAMAPVEFGGGWRFGVADAAIVPYAGLAIVRLHYQETSTFADPGDNVDAHFSGTAFFGGVDVNAADYLAISVEAALRRIPNAIGAGGVSADFKESNLGGLTVRVLIGVRFAKK